MNTYSFNPTKLHTLFERENKNGPFVMADLGLTNGGCLTTAFELISIAADLGVDAVKFQMITATELIHNTEIEYTYPTILNGNQTENMVEMFKNLELSDDDWMQIKNFCDKLGIGLIITSHVESAVERIDALELPLNKICTWSLSHWKMVEQLAKNGKPLLLDTGTITASELVELDEFYRQAGGSEIIVLFDFHTKNKFDRNFLAIQTLKADGFEVGYTPQGRDDWLDFMALGLGATILEKRLTLSRVRAANGHWKAHEATEFAEWLDHVRDCYAALGTPGLKPTKEDVDGIEYFYKSAFLQQPVAAGDEISSDHFAFKRPGHGISSKTIYQQWIGKQYQQSYGTGDLFKG
ncbi:MAG: N-acetylneuraminate synthase family protein [Roseobacter sp.]